MAWKTKASCSCLIDCMVRFISLVSTSRLDVFSSHSKGISSRAFSNAQSVAASCDCVCYPGRSLSTASMRRCFCILFNFLTHSQFPSPVHVYIYVCVCVAFMGKFVREKFNTTRSVPHWPHSTGACKERFRKFAALVDHRRGWSKRCVKLISGCFSFS